MSKNNSEFYDFLNSTGYMPWKKCSFGISCLEAKRINTILYFNNRLRVRTMGWMRESQWCWHIVFTDAFAVLIPVLIFLCKVCDKMFGCSAADLAQGPPPKLQYLFYALNDTKRFFETRQPISLPHIKAEGVYGWSKK